MGRDNYNVMALIILLIINNLFCLGKGDDDEEELKNGALFIFGDSLLDAGNNNYLPTLSKANMKPNGIDFDASGGNPTGRFTNGRTIGDIIGEELGQPHYAVPFLAPNSTGRNILHGVNYASGGGGILDSTGSIFISRLSMDSQIDYFNITRKQIDVLLGTSKARDFISKKSIFPITIGSNDFINNYLLPVISIGERLSVSSDAFVAHLLNHLKQQLTRLYWLDGRKFIIGNVGPLGCIPYQKTLNHRLNENECVELPNRLARRYNAGLKTLVFELNKDLSGATFVLANVYDIVMEIITNHQNYGFTCVNRACCGNGQVLAGIIACGPMSNVCTDRRKHVFWDPYHPSEAANLIIAQQLLDGDTKYVSPINIRQLRDI